MINIVRTDSENRDFIRLVKCLDEELTERDGELHSFYDQFNKIEGIRYVVVAYENNEPVGCGAIKEYEPDSMEVKRMYVSPGSRGKGIAMALLSELENWAAGLGYVKCVLETGKKQPEAIALYLRSGYEVIENYGQYKTIENSVCFQKGLNKKSQNK